MKKSKIAGDILAVMEVSHQSTMGGRTRTRDAKTLALQRLQLKTNPSRSPAPNLVASSTPEEEDVSSFSYLQLRSRRLEKLPPPVSNQSKLKQQGKESSSCREEKKMKKKRMVTIEAKGVLGKPGKWSWNWKWGFAVKQTTLRLERTIWIFNLETGSIFFSPFVYFPHTKKWFCRLADQIFQKKNDSFGFGLLL